MNSKLLPPFPYGAVYFRKSNPPKEDWERDYKTASEDGMNIFRHGVWWRGRLASRCGSGKLRLHLGLLPARR